MRPKTISHRSMQPRQAKWLDTHAIETAKSSYRSVILMAGAFFSARELPQVAEDVELVMRYLDVLLKEDPSDALVAGWRGEGAQVRPVAAIV